MERGEFELSWEPCNNALFQPHQVDTASRKVLFLRWTKGHYPITLRLSTNDLGCAHLLLMELRRR